MLLNKKNTAVFQVGRIVLINAIILMVLLLFFTPAEKIDDYILKFILAGAASGQSDGHLLGYSSYFLGEILKTLTKLFPSVSWYETTQYIALFVSFCVLTYLIWKRGLGVVGNAITLILLAIFGYEAYIKLTFSKTAGIACAAGLFLLFSVLNDTNLKKTGLGKNIIKIIVAGLLILVGALLRFNMFRLIFGIGVAYLIYRFACFCLDTRRGDAQITWKIALFYLSRTLVVCLLIFGCLYGLNRQNRILFSQDEGWAAYSKYNSLKAQLQDYGWPDYETYKDEYEELGIDEVMYDFWSHRDYADPEYYSMDTMENIINIKEGATDSHSSEIKSFFKEFPNRFLKEICFWAILPILVYWCLSKQRYKKLMLVVSFSLLMLLNFYQYVQGRYDQHQVNVGIWFAIALIFIACMQKETTISPKQQRAVIPIAGVFLIWFVSANYSYLSSNSYYGASYNRTVPKEIVQEFLEFASNDENHLYLTAYDDRSYGYMGYSVLEQIPAGLYHNIFCTQDLMFPTSRVSLDNYGVYNVYREIVDSDVIYYCKSDDSSEAELKRMEAYIQDLYNDTAHGCLMKRIEGFSVYGFFSDDFQLNTEDIVDISPGEEDVFSDVVIEFTTEESEENGALLMTIDVSGLIYKAESNSFNQKVYLEICYEDGEKEYQAMTICNNNATDDIMNGAYGKIYGTYTTDLTYGDQNITYNIILECDEGMYRLLLEVNDSI